MIRSDRLVLRRWREADLDPFAALCADPEVMEHFPAMLDRGESQAFIARAEQHFEDHGFGLFAVEVSESRAFVGYVGLVKVRFEAAFTPAVEIGWRLSRDAWGFGYASEAARAALAFAFEEVGLDEVVSFTVPANVRSQAVMERIGLRRARGQDFDHPALPSGHPMQRHVLYRLRRAAWSAAGSAGPSLR